MPKRLILRYSNLILSGWVVIVIDIFLVNLSLFLANLFRFDFELAEISEYHIYYQLAVASVVTLISLLVTGSHKGIIRYTGQHDALRIFKAITLSVLIITIMNYALLLIGMKLNSDNHVWISNLRVIPNSVLLIFYPVSLFSMLVFRMSIKLAYYSITSTERGVKANVLIYGAGKEGIGVRNTLSGEQATSYHVLGFMDDHPGKIGKTIQGVPVFNPATITNEFLLKHDIREIIIAMPRIGEERKLDIYNHLLTFNVNVKNVPPIDTWIDGKLKLDQIRNLRIEDLLQREPIRLGNASLKPAIEGKTVMVTGAAGSIGSELTRQLLHFNPRELILVDQAESPMFALEQELKEIKANLEATGLEYKTQMEFIIADVSNQSRISDLVKTIRPDLIYHAAAYKHVPLMEMNPLEAIRVNVFGTRNLAEAASWHGVEKFIMISTDKAVNPTNIMGASKRLAEIFIQSLNGKPGNKTAFITTRFGNVLGSNGSVTETFKKQIMAGGPLTVTHPEITRYFMTIPEACQLVFEAGVMGKGGEIFIFDMGKPVKIVDLANNMIRLSGHIPDKDIKISFSGLRPGEKLYEELLNDKELTQPTHHPKIMIATVRDYNMEEVVAMLDHLTGHYESGDPFRVVRHMKRIIPEYVSNNSVFSSLDVEKLPYG